MLATCFRVRQTNDIILTGLIFSTLAAILILFICYKQKINFPLVNPFLLIKASRIKGQEISLAPKVSAVLNFRRQLEGGPRGFFPGKGETIWGPFFQRNVVCC